MPPSLRPRQLTGKSASRLGSLPLYPLIARVYPRKGTILVATEWCQTHGSLLERNDLSTSVPLSNCSQHAASNSRPGSGDPVLQSVPCEGTFSVHSSLKRAGAHFGQTPTQTQGSRHGLRTPVPGILSGCRSTNIPCFHKVFHDIPSFSREHKRAHFCFPEVRKASHLVNGVRVGTVRTSAASFCLVVNAQLRLEHLAGHNGRTRLGRLSHGSVATARRRR